MTILSKTIQNIFRFFSDENLTKKAYLNILNTSGSYVTKLLVGFIITPLMVAGLGSYFYGLWQIINRMVGYLTPTSGRPTEALTWILAKHQASRDYQQKRRYVGSALLVWGVFIPITVILGAILAWFAPSWIQPSLEYYHLIRITIMIMVMNLTFQVFAYLPQSILVGENMGYKRMGLTILLTLVSGLFSWIALYFETGIVGLSLAALFSTLLNGILYFSLAKRYTPWFGVERPTFELVHQFFSLSGWFLVWNLIWISMISSDVVILGLFTSVETVTTYTLTKYSSEILISFIIFLVGGITPGLGGIYGSGDLQKASNLRNETMSISWLISTTFGAVVLQWNHVFMRLWVGEEYYAGHFSTLLIVVMIVQFALLQTDASIINITLGLRNKVILGGLSSLLSILLAITLITTFNWGIVGVCLGFIVGRMILSFGYPIIIGNIFKVQLSSQIQSVSRPAMTTISLFLLAFLLDNSELTVNWSGISGWIFFFVAASMMGVVILLLAFYLGLTFSQRNSIIRHIELVIIQQ